MANDHHPNSDSNLSPGERFTFTLDESNLPEAASRAQLRDELLPLSEAVPRAPETKSLSSAQMHPVRSSGAMETSSSPLQDEIDSMRRALNRLLESFSQVESIEEQYKLSSAINLTTASLAKFIPHSMRDLVRTQDYLLLFSEFDTM